MSSTGTNENPDRPNRPPGDDFHQQRLKAWQPILTPWHVIALFFAISAAFIPTGVYLLHESNQVSNPSNSPAFIHSLTVY